MQPFRVALSQPKIEKYPDFGPQYAKGKVFSRPQVFSTQSGFLSGFGMLVF